MARIALFEKQEPLMVETKEGPKAFCQCGLSTNFPYCTGMHKKTQDEDPNKLYQYVEDERIVIGEKDTGEGDTCGCGHDHDHDHHHEHGEGHTCACEDGDDEKEDGACCGGACGCKD